MRIGRWLAHLGRVLLGLGLLAAVFAWLRPSWDGWPPPWWPGWGIGGIGTALGSLFASSRWKAIQDVTGGRPFPLSLYGRAFVSSRWLGQFLPAVWVDVLGRAAWLRAGGSDDRWSRLGGIILLERSLDVALPLALLLAALGTAKMAEGTALALAALVAALAVPLSRWALGPMVHFGLRLEARLRRVPVTPVPPLPSAIAWRVGALSVLRYGALLLQFWGMGAAVGVALPLRPLLAASTLSQLAAVIAVTPGGLGFQDGGWAAGLAWQGLDPEATARFVVAARLGLLINFGLLAGIAWLAPRPAPRRSRS